MIDSIAFIINTSKKQNQSMLKKYENFFKLSKTPQCSFYEANARQDMNKAILKKLKSTWSWNQMLKSHALKLQLSQNFTTKILEIFKHKGNYFVVYEKPHGPSLKCSQQSVKLEIDEFYNVCNDLVDIVEKLKRQIFNLYIYPEWIFLHRNGVKVCHFEPYFQEKKDKKEEQNHVFIYDIVNGNLDGKKLLQTLEPKSKRIKNLNFNLGYIAYHLLTGSATEWNEGQQYYQTKIKQIQINAKSKILKTVDDKILANLIVKLLNCSNDQKTFDQVTFENDLFDEFHSYLKRKRTECRSCKIKRQSFRIVEFSLEKMKLQKKPPKIKTQKKKKCFRPCCCKNLEDGVQPQAEDNNDKYEVVNRHEKEQQVVLKNPQRIRTQNSPKTSKKKLEERTFSNLKMTTKIKVDSSNLLPVLGTERKKSTVFSRTKLFRAREISFKNSMEEHIGRTYLKTEY